MYQFVVTAATVGDIELTDEQCQSFRAISLYAKICNEDNLPEDLRGWNSSRAQ